MKKTTKAAQLRLVRNVVRELSPTKLAEVSGGIRCNVLSVCGNNTQDCTISYVVNTL